MSDDMLLGVLRMPFDDYGDMDLIQLRSRCHEAAYKIEQLVAEVEGQQQRFLAIRAAIDGLAIPELSNHGRDHA